MSRQKIFNMIKSRGSEQNGRNAFDLSGFESYTEKCMTINPLRCIDTIPDDYFDINISDFIQGLTPMKTAAFLRGTREIAAYYVPYNTIWHNFNQYQATREDPDSSVLKAKGIQYEPRLGQYQLYCQILALYCEYVFCHYYEPLRRIFAEDSDLWLLNSGSTSSVVGQPVSESEFYSLLDFYESSAKNLVISLQGVSVDPLWINALGSSSWFTVRNGASSLVSFSPTFYELTSSNTVHRYDIACDTVGNYAWADACRKLDMLGYGNIYPIFDSVERLLNGSHVGTYSSVIDYYFSHDWSSITTVSDAAAEMDVVLVALRANIEDWIKKAVVSLKTICNSDSSIVNIAFDTTIAETYLNVYPLFAYNRCFYDMFRNSYFDLDYNVRDYNCDYLDCTTLAGSILSNSDVSSRFYKLESHQYKKDMFTGVLPDTQFGAISAISISNVSLSGTASLSAVTGSDVGRWVGTGSSVSGDSLGVGYFISGDDSHLTNLDDSKKALSHSHPVSGTASISSAASIPNAFNVLALRRAECLQQYRMDLLRAGNKTRDIFKQIYGSSPKSEIDEAPYFIDVMGQSINVDPIIANAETGTDTNGSLGDIAARVTVRGDGHFKFSTKDFGCLMILDYTLIDASYNSTLLDPERTILTQEGHFIPQLMNLGFSPVLGDSLHLFKNASVRHQTLGYSLPYLEKKTYIDKVHGNLCQVSIPGFDDYVGENSIWSIVRLDMQESSAVQLRHFYGNPNILDNVMVLQYGPSMSNDQFICHTLIKVDSVRQLSELGLPRFC